MSFPKPSEINMMILPKQIPRRLNKYNTKLCSARKKLFNAIPMPVTARGGINATEIAIPVIALSTSGFAYA